MKRGKFKALLDLAAYLPEFPHIFSSLAEIRYQTCANKAAEHLKEFQRTRRREDRHF